MSQTGYMDMTGPGRWAHMATSLAEVLESLSATSEEVPASLRQAANYFFDLVLQVAEGHVPENPSASVANYRIAADAFMASGIQANNVQAVAREIRRYSGLLGKIGQDQALSEDETRSVSELIAFLRELAAAGGEEHYRDFLVGSLL
jgi:hypothetical protein